jgi:hypothetical protein
MEPQIFVVENRSEDSSQRAKNADDPAEKGFKLAGAGDELAVK